MKKTKYSTGATRNDATGKGRFDLLPPDALRLLAIHFEHGAKMHAPRNWEMGIPTSRYVDSALRHLNQWLEGKTDEPHLTAFAWNAICLLATFDRIKRGTLPKELDDLPRY